MTKTTKTNEATTIKVHMVTNDHGESIRMVQLPKKFQNTDLEYILEAVFMNGQNEIQPIEMTCSVSMGDVIELDVWDGDFSCGTCHGQWTKKFHIVQSMGFQEMTAEELEEYKAIDEYDRTWSKFVRPEYAARRAAKENN